MSERHELTRRVPEIPTPATARGFFADFESDKEKLAELLGITRQGLRELLKLEEQSGLILEVRDSS